MERLLTDKQHRINSLAIFARKKMNMYRIVQGNSFYLHIIVSKIDISRDFQRVIDLNINKKEVSVSLINSFDDAVSLPVTVEGVNDNIIVCKIPNTLDFGQYDIKVECVVGDARIVSIDRYILRIVYSNQKSCIPTEPISGSSDGLLSLRYYVVTENQSVCNIDYTLYNIAIDNNITSIINGQKYEATLTPNEGFGYGTIKVVMNGRDITAECYDNGKIIIPAVSGYVSIIALADESICYYGASEAGSFAEFDLSSIESYVYDLNKMDIAIETTSSKPYIWFASRIPLVFKQAEIEAPMHHRYLGNLHYYFTDELLPGINHYKIAHK